MLVFPDQFTSSGIFLKRRMSVVVPEEGTEVLETRQRRNCIASDPTSHTVFVT